MQHALGRPDEALQLSREALRRGRQLKHPFTLTHALMNSTMLYYHRREPEAVRELAEAEIAMAQEHGFREPSSLAGHCTDGQLRSSAILSEERLKPN